MRSNSIRLSACAFAIVLGTAVAAPGLALAAPDPASKGAAQTPAKPEVTMAVTKGGASQTARIK